AAMSSRASPITVDNEEHKIIIGVIPGSTKFNITVDIEVHNYTEYEVIFVNTDDLVSHNFYVGPHNVKVTESSIITVTTVFKVGPVSTDNSQPGGPNVVFTGNWTTGADGWHMFFCTFAGHFATMQGWIKVGENPGSKPAASAPGFEVIVGFLSLLTVSAVVLRKRLR
ncbi:MAG TPA: hypothetical protein VJ044_11505, partial [Candidatus Hodarchaeales archaeon]|nr:hypothetical protein [Candidatus Hodarchaeales archaeon]